MEPAAAMAPGELDAMLRAASDFASYPGHACFLLPFGFGRRIELLGSFFLPHCSSTFGEGFCLPPIIEQREAFIQPGLLTSLKNIGQLACKVALHLLDKAGDSAAAVETFVHHNLYSLLINCLIEGDEEISAIVLDAIKRLAEIPKGIDIIFPPDGQGSVQLDKVAAQSSSMARIRILSLVAKLFTVSSCIATAICD